MNINVTLPNVVPLAASPPTEAAHRDNVQRPQIVPPKEMAPHPSGTQVGSEQERSKDIHAKISQGSSIQTHHDRVEERLSNGGRGQSGQQSNSDTSERDDSKQRSPFNNINLDALLARAKASQKDDRKYYHRTPPGAPASPEDVRLMRQRNQVIANRYQMSYQTSPQPGLSLHI
ncbi:MAG: hypothetical protein CENE_01958 [Candidatus Celerinatantimonas neptuna]|nr:MAG: hypothetical protein CENE_01958 [Candidatus Celerinatantimonas neptuna]